MWSWKRRGRFGPWLGRGPFSNLLHLERQGWLYALRPYPAESKPADELEALRAYAKDLKQELKGLEARIKELAAANGED